MQKLQERQSEETGDETGDETGEERKKKQQQQKITRLRFDESINNMQWNYQFKGESFTFKKKKTTPR